MEEETDKYEALKAQAKQRLSRGGLVAGSLTTSNHSNTNTIKYPPTPPPGRSGVSTGVNTDAELAAKLRELNDRVAKIEVRVKKETIAPVIRLLKDIIDDEPFSIVDAQRALEILEGLYDD